MATNSFPVSYPARPGAPSFLDLPPELRNAVYEELFIYPHPLLVTGFTDQSLHRRWGENGYENEGLRHTLWFHHPYYLEPPYVLSPQGVLERAYEPSLGFFLTCKQIYKEAATVFYGKNTFQIRKTKYHFSELQGGYDHNHDLVGRHLLLGALWMKNRLGSQLSMLRNVTFDLGTLCAGYECSYADGLCWMHQTPEEQAVLRNARHETWPNLPDDQKPIKLDLLPLLRILWAGTNVNISFVVTDLETEAEWRRDHEDAPNLLSGFPDAEALTRLLHSFRDGALGLNDDPSGLLFVKVNRDGNGGFYSCRAVLFSFIADAGRNVRFTNADQ